MEGQISFPVAQAQRAGRHDAWRVAADPEKALDLLARFQASRFTVYGRKPGHKNFHPTSPSRGLYNCTLLHQERFKDPETAQRAADSLTKANPGWTFQVREI